MKVAGRQRRHRHRPRHQREKRAVVTVELSGPLSVLGEDTICSRRAAVADRRVLHRLRARRGRRSAADDGRRRIPRHPGRQTRQTVQNDLVQNTLRLPFKRAPARCSSTSSAPRWPATRENLNKAIRRGAPGARADLARSLDDPRRARTRRSATSTSTPTGSSAELAERRQDVIRLHPGGRRHGRDLGRAPRRPLAELRRCSTTSSPSCGPTLTELDNLAVQRRRCSPTSRAAARADTLSRNLPAFNRSATTVAISAREAATSGTSARSRRAATRSSSSASRRRTHSRPPTTSTKFLRDIDDPNRAVEVDARAAARHRPQGADRLHRHGGAPQLRSTTRPSRSTSTTRSGTCCTSRSSRSARPRAANTTPACTRAR